MTTNPPINAWLTDLDPAAPGGLGYLAGSLNNQSPSVSHDQFVLDAKANGHGVVFQDDPGATEPPTRPPTPAEQALITAATQLTILRQTPWSKLTLVEQQQATDLAFQLGLPVPQITATS